MAKRDAVRGSSETGDPLLLTPGPLTTSKRVKEVMVHDWGSRDAAFLRINREVLERLPEVVNAKGSHVTVPMQGSGTFAVEAMLTELGERDVDTAGDQDHQQSDGENDVDGAGVQQIERVAQREEAVAGQ